MNNPYQVNDFPDPFIRNSNDWRAEARCRTLDDPDLWFPNKGEHDGAYAKKICNSCPVRHQCRNAARATDFGIWGGLTESQRRGHQNERSAS